ncbi:phosphotransferase family protein [Deinococcus sp.]|uniref:phosphotransferase family protein n=1 Tax=Deinococcus sp. TaxID=47478 RepID=UPI003C79E562
MDELRVREIIAAQLPELAGLNVTRLGEGTDHWVFDVAGQRVLRFPKTDEAATRLLTEARLTAWLAPQLPLAIPVYDVLGRPCVQFSRAFGGYQKLPGTPAILLPEHRVAWLTAASKVGETLRVLHRLSTADARRLGVQPEDQGALAEWSEQAEADLAFALAHGHVPVSEAAAWRAYLAAPPDPAPGPPQLIHGDLAAEHLLIGAPSVPEQGRATGLIDWSDSVLGDPALDLAGLLHWGGVRMLKAALESYGGADRATLRRAQWYAACRAFADIVYGQTQERPEYLLAAGRALRTWPGLPAL